MALLQYSLLHGNREVCLVHVKGNTRSASPRELCRTCHVDGRCQKCIKCSGCNLLVNPYVWFWRWCQPSTSSCGEDYPCVFHNSPSSSSWHQDEWRSHRWESTPAVVKVDSVQTSIVWYPRYIVGAKYLSTIMQPVFNNNVENQVYDACFIKTWMSTISEYVTEIMLQ